MKAFSAPLIVFLTGAICVLFIIGDDVLTCALCGVLIGMFLQNAIDRSPPLLCEHEYGERRSMLIREGMGKMMWATCTKCGKEKTWFI